MNLKKLTAIVRQTPVHLELISAEGDIYLCRINDKEWLTDGSEEKPKIFHSIFEAKHTLGKELSDQLDMVMSTTYDEMISSGDTPNNQSIRHGLSKIDQ
ncbi:DUF6482 family protein [Endozoicomonas numazuensis]|uniref:Uncharacterized protein n=1 Tax=Endozoicomonas numazuensis TaxID=1137799 RepID=A0A081NF98_9GAMM|nr:DUF6482 family protein [Endozoicomonas numazuensis]KEQ17121.1 hypothetical protein GZ78_14700 [Endozoicomonas numazuensis]